MNWVIIPFLFCYDVKCVWKREHPFLCSTNFQQLCQTLTRTLKLFMKISILIEQSNVNNAACVLETQQLPFDVSFFGSIQPFLSHWKCFFIRKFIIYTIVYGAQYMYSQSLLPFIDFFQSKLEFMKCIQANCSKTRHSSEWELAF